MSYGSCKKFWIVFVLLSLWRTQNSSIREAVVSGDSYSTLLSVFTEFCSPRVVIINWNSRSIVFQLLLSLCGEVHLNP